MVRKNPEKASLTFDSPNFLNTGRFTMEYTVDSGHTSYSFDYGSNESGVLKEFYAKLGYYMNISDSEIESLYSVV